MVPKPRIHNDPREPSLAQLRCASEDRRPALAGGAPRRRPASRALRHDRADALVAMKLQRERVQALDLHPLTPQERDHFQEEWRSVQAEFVDAPDKAVTEADRLLQQVMQARGYPVGDFEQRAADISVEHAAVVTHYRTAHDIAQRNRQGKGTTEDLRQAMVHDRTLFEELLETAEAEERVKEPA